MQLAKLIVYFFPQTKQVHCEDIVNVLIKENQVVVNFKFESIIHVYSKSISFTIKRIGIECI